MDIEFKVHYMEDAWTKCEFDPLTLMHRLHWHFRFCNTIRHGSKYFYRCQEYNFYNTFDCTSVTYNATINILALCVRKTINFLQYLNPSHFILEHEPFATIFSQCNFMIHPVSFCSLGSSRDFEGGEIEDFKEEKKVLFFLKKIIHLSAEHFNDCLNKLLCAFLSLPSIKIIPGCN